MFSHYERSFVCHGWLPGFVESTKFFDLKKVTCTRLVVAWLSEVCTSMKKKKSWDIKIAISGGESTLTTYAVQCRDDLGFSQQEARLQDATSLHTPLESKTLATTEGLYSGNVSDLSKRLLTFNL